MTDVLPPERARAPRYRLLIALAAMIYFTSYLTRLNYGAAIVDIVQNTSLSLTQAGSIGTALFIAYGVMQPISGILGDKIAPEKIILTGLGVTILCNALFPFCPSPILMIAVWTLNGIAQAMFWPPLVKIMTDYLRADLFVPACFWVQTACQAATVLIYLIVPLFIVTAGWRAIFWFSAGFAALVCVVWVIGFGAVKAATPRQIPPPASPAETGERAKTKLFPVLLSCGIFPILIAIALQGFLKDGITTWLPAYISEVFGFSAAASVLMNVLLPVATIAAMSLFTLVYRKTRADELTVAATLFGISAVLTLLLILFPHAGAAFFLIVVALIVAIMHGINLVLISYLPRRFAVYGKSSTVSGLTNAFTYVGSSSSSFSFAAIAEAGGWHTLVPVWTGCAAAGTVICLLCLGRWRKFIRRKEPAPPSEVRG